MSLDDDAFWIGQSIQRETPSFFRRLEKTAASSKHDTEEEVTGEIIILLPRSLSTARTRQITLFKATTSPYSLFIGASRRTQYKNCLTKPLKTIAHPGDWWTSDRSVVEQLPSQVN